MQSNAQYLLNLENRIAELETQVCNLNEKSLGVKKHKKEITDTERLDFIEKNNIELTKIRKEWGVLSSDDVLSIRENLRQAIDAAIRGKDGE